jgi:hypothetical protein
MAAGERPAVSSRSTAAPAEAKAAQSNAPANLPMRKPSDDRECENMLRPCPFISCRFHLVVDVLENGALRLNRRIRGKRPRLNADETDPMKIQRFMRRAAKAIAETDPDWSCALDVARRGDLLYDEIAEVYALTGERIRQVDTEGRERLREAITT